MEMRFKNEIKKLSDVVVWSDNAIKEMRMDFPDLPEEEFENLPAVKDFEDVKEAVNNAIKRHAVYTSALKNDFANKVAEVEKLTKELGAHEEENKRLSEKIMRLKEEIEGRKKAFNELMEEMANRYIAIETHDNICKDYEETRRELEAYWKNKCMKIQKKDQDKMNELEEDNKILHERIYSAEELHIKLSEENEKLKVEVTEALAKRDYYQDLANKEAADAKKAKQDCEKEIEWQKKKLQEFDYVLTKYRAKIKELENADRFSELVINLIMKG